MNIELNIMIQVVIVTRSIVMPKFLASLEISKENSLIAIIASPQNIGCSSLIFAKKNVESPMAVRQVIANKVNSAKINQIF